MKILQDRNDSLPKIDDRLKQKERIIDRPQTKAGGARDIDCNGYPGNYEELPVKKELVMKLFCHTSFRKSST
jgi:hypothetical protein